MINIAQTSTIIIIHYNEDGSAQLLDVYKDKDAKNKKCSDDNLGLLLVVCAW